MALFRTAEKAFAITLKPRCNPCKNRVGQIVSWHQICYLSVLPLQPHHRIHTSGSLSSSLFNLGGLSTSRESQYLAKERGMPRTEFSPHLELIRSSEVDTQQASGSIKASAPILKRQKPARGSVVTNSTDGFVTIPQTVYRDLKDGIKTLEKRLEMSERTSQQLLNSYQKRTREGITLGGICLLLTLAVVYFEKIQNFRLSTLQALGADHEEKTSLAEEKSRQKSTSQSLGITWPVGLDADFAKSSVQTAQAPEARQPWTLSRLLWAADR